MVRRNQWLRPAWPRGLAAFCILKPWIQTISGCCVWLACGQNCCGIMEPILSWVKYDSLCYVFPSMCFPYVFPAICSLCVPWYLFPLRVSHCVPYYVFILFCCGGLTDPGKADESQQPVPKYNSFSITAWPACTNSREIQIVKQLKMQRNIWVSHSTGISFRIFF